MNQTAKMDQREFLDFPLALPQALKNLLGREVDLIENQQFKNVYLQASMDEAKQLIFDRETGKEEAVAGR